MSGNLHKLDIHSVLHNLKRYTHTRTHTPPHTHTLSEGLCGLLTQMSFRLSVAPLELLSFSAAGAAGAGGAADAAGAAGAADAAGASLPFQEEELRGQTESCSHASPAPAAAAPAAAAPAAAPAPPVFLLP